MINHSENLKVLITLISEFITLYGDFYDIRNFSIAFPFTCNSLSKRIHHFVIHGYSTNKSKEKRIDEFEDWCTRSLSLKLNSEDPVFCKHYFLEDADIMNHDNDPEGPATISTEEAYFCSNFLKEYDSTSRSEFYNKIDQFCLKTSPEQELKSFRKLFDNAELRRWFYEIEEISSFYDHITIIFSLATQTIHCDIGLVIKYLFMEARMKPEAPISNFSIISLKSEISQEWVFHGSREGGLSLFDLFVQSELKMLGEEATYEMYPDCRISINERIECLNGDITPFKTQVDEVWNSCILKKIRDFQFLQKHYADLKAHTSSITDIQQFKSYDLILSRDLSKMELLNIERQTKILMRPQSKITTTPLMLFSNIFQDIKDRNKRMTIIHQVFSNTLMLASFATTMLLDKCDNFPENFVSDDDSLSERKGDNIPYNGDVIIDKIMYPNIVDVRNSRLERLGYGGLPWIYEEPFYLRLSIFKDLRGRKRWKEKYKEFLEIYSKEIEYLAFNDTP